MENEGLEIVDDQMHYGQPKHSPYGIKKQLAPASVSAKEGHYIVCPRQHRRKHEKEIQHGVAIQKPVNCIHIAVLVQNSPAYIRYKITRCGKKKMPAAYRKFFVFPGLVRADLYILKGLVVDYEIDDESKYTYDRV